MKKNIFICALFMLTLWSGGTIAQPQLKQSILSQGELKSVFDDKFHWGVSLNLYWTTIAGEMVEKSYFLKPSLGGTIRAEYYFNSFIGIGVSAGFQQRGAGIMNVDNSGGAFSHPWITNDAGEIGNLDSTYLERLRFSTLEFPVTVLLRTPKDVFEGMRLSAAAGPVFIHNMSTNLTMQRIVDGFHPYNWVTDNYIRNEVGVQGSFGVEIDSGGGQSIFQLHFVYTRGLKNVYAKNQGEGYHMSYGVRLAWLF